VLDPKRSQFGNLRLGGARLSTLHGVGAEILGAISLAWLLGDHGFL
jgi:hypothetical protein